jgi:hypothetical protein
MLMVFNITVTIAIIVLCILNRDNYNKIERLKMNIDLLQNKLDNIGGNNG